jgi:hypothetical protein
MRQELNKEQVCLTCYTVKQIEQGEAVVRFGSYIEFTCDDCKNKKVQTYEYKLEVTFKTDRRLTEEELGQLQAQCCVQVEEPTNHEGEDETYTTSDICTDIRLLWSN